LGSVYLFRDEPGEMVTGETGTATGWF